MGYRHNCDHYRILVLLILCFYAMNTMAQYDMINKHVIIAFDNSLPNDTYIRNKARIKNALIALLSDVKLQKGDYYSLVNFGINESVASISKLARPILDYKGEIIAWREYESMDDILSQGDWLNMVDTQDISDISKGGSPFSLLTGAKAYPLICLPKRNGRKMVNKTYHILVTDNQYNANNDQSTEFDQFKSGDKVRIVDGNFANVEGYVARIAGHQRGIVEMQGVCLVAAAYTPSVFLEKITENVKI